MAYSFIYYTGDGATTDFTYSYGYISTSHVSVKIDGVLTTTYIWFSPTVIRFTTAPASGALIFIYRSTSPGTRLVTYETGTTMTKVILEADSKQAFYLMQEALDGQSLFMTQDVADSKWNANSKVIKNGATPTATTDITTKGYVDDAITTQITAIGAGTVVGPVTTVSGNVVLWDSTNGTAVSDAGFSLANYVQGEGDMVAGNVVRVNANRIIEDAGYSSSDAVIATSAATSTNQIAVSDTSSKSIKYMEDGPDSTFLSTAGGVPYWTVLPHNLVLLGSASLSAGTIFDFTVISNDYITYQIYGSGLYASTTATNFQCYLRSDTANLGAYRTLHTGASGVVYHSGAYVLGTTATFSGTSRGIVCTLVGQNGGIWAVNGMLTAGNAAANNGGALTVVGHSEAAVTGATTIRVTSGLTATSGNLRIYGVKA